MSTSSSPSISSPIIHKLSQVRQRKTWVGAGTALVQGGALLLACMMAAMALDWWLMPRGIALRTAVTTTALLVAAALFVHWIVTLVIRSRRWEQVASDVDRTVAGMEERWLTVTEIEQRKARSDAPERVHPAMWRTLTRQAASREPDVIPGEVVSLSRFYLGLNSCLGLLVVLMIWLMLDGSLMTVLLQRFWFPTSPISMTKIAVTTPSHIVARGEPLAISATTAGRSVHKAEVRINYPDSNKTDSRRLFPHDDKPGQWAHAVPQVQEPLRYQLLAGDAATEWKSVTVADRPELAAIRFRALPPAYTEMSAIDVEELPTSVRLITGTEVHISFLPRHSVQQFEVRIDDKTSLPLQADEEGWYHWQFRVDQPVTFSPTLVESHGLRNLYPPVCHLEAYQDQAPVVEIVTPDDDVAVTPTEKIEIGFEANDDLGIQRAELVVYSESTVDGVEPQILSVTDIPIAADEDRRKLHGKTQLDLSQYNLKTGSQIGYAVRVYDGRDTSTIPAGMEGQRTEGTERTEGTAATERTEATEGRQETDGMPTQDAIAQRTDLDKATESPTAADSTAATAAAPNASPLQPATTAADPAAAKESSNAPGPSPNQLADSSASNTKQDANATPAPVGNSNAQRATLGSANPSTTQSSAASKPNATSTDASSETKRAPKQTAATPADPAEMKPSADSDSSPAEPKLANAATPSGNRDADAASKPNAASTAETQKPSEQAATTRADPAEKKPPSDSKESPSTPQVAEAATPSEQATTNASPAQATSKPQTLTTGAADAPPKEQGKVAMPAGFAPRSPEKNPDSQPENSDDSPPGAQPPGDKMTKRMLDVGSQSSTSKRKTLKVDEYAGSFKGQQREKVAMAIAPVIDELNQLLAQAEVRVTRLILHVESSHPWTKTEADLVGNVDKLLIGCEQLTDALKKQSENTPYAFVGLQFSDISHSHVTPARDSLWESLQGEPNRLDHLRASGQHIATARQKISDLIRQFDRIRREHNLEDNLDRVKKMYQVYVEDALLELVNGPDAINEYQTQPGEVDVNDEYLARLQEVLEMRRDLMAELARILGEDPRLLQRYTNRFLKSNDTLRDQVTLLSLRQQALQQEVAAWSEATEEERQGLLNARGEQHRAESAAISEKLADFQDRFVAWSPLNMDLKQGLLKEVHRKIVDVSADAQLLSATEAPEKAADANSAESSTAWLAHAAKRGRNVYQGLGELDTSLRKMAADSAGDELSAFAARRIAHNREILEMATAWIRQADLLSQGKMVQVAAVDQYRLAQETERLFQNLINANEEFASLLSQGDNTMPADISQLAAEISTLFEKQLAPSQLAATFSLQRDRLEAALTSEARAAETFEAIDKKFDDLFKRMIEELNKLPVDPLADLLNDPTLDELLRMLELESSMADELGIPGRPTNLQIIGDWMQPNRRGGSGANMGQEFRKMLQAMLRQEQQKLARQAERAAEEAKRRADEEAGKLPRTKLAGPEERVRRNTDKWNLSAAKLSDELLQGEGSLPPEQFRQMIEQYMQTLSGLQREPTSAPNN